MSAWGCPTPWLQSLGPTKGSRGQIPSNSLPPPAPALGLQWREVWNLCPQEAGVEAGMGGGLDFIFPEVCMGSLSLTMFCGV